MKVLSHLPRLVFSCNACWDWFGTVWAILYWCSWVFCNVVRNDVDEGRLRFCNLSTSGCFPLTENEAKFAFPIAILVAFDDIVWGVLWWLLVLADLHMLLSRLG